MNNCVLISGNANLSLAKKIANYLDKSLATINISRFFDGEVSVQIEENIRGKDIFFIQPTSPPVNENLMELLVILLWQVLLELWGVILLPLRIIPAA